MTKILITKHFKNVEDKEPSSYSFRVLSRATELFYKGNLKDAKRSLIKRLYIEGFNIDEIEYCDGVAKYDL